MKTFIVEAEYLRGSIITGVEVYSDGEVVDPWSGTETEIKEIIVGYAVHTYDDYLHLDTEFYPVKTDTTDWSDDHEEVLEKIKADYPAGEWQNNNW